MKTPTIFTAPPRKDPLLETIRNHFDLFHTRSGQAYAMQKDTDRCELLTIRSDHFYGVVAELLHKHTGKVLPRSTIKGYADLLAVLARKGTKINVSTRIGQYDGSIFIDLANQDDEQVRIAPDGVEVIPARKSPARFLSRRGALPQANPDNQGALSRLFHFLNVEDPDHQKLVIAWLVMSLTPSGPYPILAVQGEQGSGKSCLCRLLRDLIDPAVPYLENFPRSERDLLVSAHNGHLLAFDNISTVSDSMSDALCRISTGGGITSRKLYTDLEEVRLDARKPIVLNGITDLFSRQDVCDRSIMVRTARIAPADRLPERDLMRRWEQEKPRILAGLYAAIATALRNLDGVELDTYPRMADFARFIVAAEPALPWAPGGFLQAYDRNRMGIIDDAIDADPVASAVTELVTHYPAGWVGRPTVLLDTLNCIVSDDIRRLKTWPKIANQLSAKLNRCSSFLRARHIDVKTGDKDAAGHRIISVLPIEQSQPVQPAHAPAPVSVVQPLPPPAQPVSAQPPVDYEFPEQPNTCLEQDSDLD